MDKKRMNENWSVPHWWDKGMACLFAHENRIHPKRSGDDRWADSYFYSMAHLSVADFLFPAFVERGGEKRWQ
ncbi:hypothetical protein AV540_05850 [Brevibacillus parabrevis]|nr:hypothetical protein AV540_05850 [Brevibacillus parabrevis]